MENHHVNITALSLLNSPTIWRALRALPYAPGTSCARLRFILDQAMVVPPTAEEKKSLEGPGSPDFPQWRQWVPWGIPSGSLRMVYKTW